MTSMGTRHPVIVLIHDNEEDLSGAIGILTHHTNEYKTIPLNDDTVNYLQQTSPKVILFALSTVDLSIEYYSNLIEEGELGYAHQAILLCKNKESGVAFQCCLKGLFDNYFVFQPLYEKYRLLMIVQNSLDHILSTDEIFKFYDEKIEEIDDELESLIEDSCQVKQDLLDRFQQSKKDVENLSEQIIDTKNVDKGALLSAITNDHVKPLLSMLEGDIQQSIDNIITQLMTQKASAIASMIDKQQFLKQGNTPNSTEDNDELPPIEQTHATNSNTELEETEDENDELPPTKDDGPKGLLDLYAHKTTVPPKKSQLEDKPKTTKILVVEDNAIYREMLINVLNKHKYDVHGAEDGLFALDMIKREQFDLIIMDLYMPKLDGLNTTKKIRELSDGKDVPVIALTGNKNKENVKKWLNYGLKGYILKPSSTEAILDAVNGALGVKESAK